VGDRCRTQLRSRVCQSRISTNSPSTWPKVRLQSGHRQSPWRSSALVGSTQDSSDLVMAVKSMRHLTMSTIAPIVHPDSLPVYLRLVDTYRIYDGTDENGIVGTVAPGLFAQEGRCWRMIYANPVGHGTHCMQPWNGSEGGSSWTAGRRSGRASATPTICHGPSGRVRHSLR
jgi:hypothetical protein